MWDRLRFSITITIIAVGIASLVGILSAADSLAGKMMESFGQFSGEIITISNSKVDLSSKSYQDHTPKPLSRYDMERLGTLPWSEGIKGVSCLFESSAVVLSGGRASNPNVEVVGAEDSYLTLENLKIECGFLARLSEASHSCIMGKSLAAQLHASVGDFIEIGEHKFRISALLKKGEADNKVIISWRYPWGGSASYQVNAITGSSGEGRLHRMMRYARRLTPIEEDDFSITRGGTGVESFEKICRIMRMVSLSVSLITLLGAGIALMNILLVSVNERRGEIGLKKALGATSGRIRREFLLEALKLSLKGCLWGTLAGVAIGNLVTMGLESDFVIPWLWIAAAVLSSVTVGLLAGTLPAAKAARLTPSQALQRIC